MKGFHALLLRFAILFTCLLSSVALSQAQPTITTYTSQVSQPEGVAVDRTGNLYIADSLNRRVLRVTPDGVISTFVGNGQIRIPTSVALDANGNVIITDTYSLGNRIDLDSNNNRVLKINPDGIVVGFLGGAYDWYFFDYDAGGLECVAGVATDAAGNVFVAEPESNFIWKITPQGDVTPAVGGLWGFGGDGGPATSARLSLPNGLAIDAGGNLFIADSYNNRIRKVTPDGIITTVAGNGTPGFSGDGGPALSAQLSYPLGVAVDARGNLFIADSSNNRIRKVTPDGIITTLAGNGTAGFSGDGGPPDSAQLSYPSSVAVDGAGHLFIADWHNDRIREVTFALAIPTLAGLSPTVGAQGATVNVTLMGTSFDASLTVDPGPGITVQKVVVTGTAAAVATLTISPDAIPGTRNLSVRTGQGTSGEIPFTVVMPFPNLRVTGFHSGNFGVGFNGVFTVNVSNVGSVPTTSAITLTDTLPPGLNFVSGNGPGWSCSATGKTVVCTYPELPADYSTTLDITVAVDSGAAPIVTHTVVVSTEGDLDPTLNSASDATTVVPAPTLQLPGGNMAPGSQQTLSVHLLAPLPFDVTGTLTISFSPNAANPVDDPAIQFSTGGRTVTFTIRANFLYAGFENGGPVGLGQIGFQPGTVAGTVTFTLQAGTVVTTNSTAIPQIPPVLRSIQTLTDGGFAALITSISSTREVTQLNLQFNTTPAVRLSCGTVAGCSASGSTLTFDVRSVFDEWFRSDTTFGGLSMLRVPLAIDPIIHGTVLVTLGNSRGISNAAMPFSLP